MRKYKRKHYSKFSIMTWYSWPEFNVLTTEIYSIPFDFRFRFIK
jgi:hypothetical protein